MKEPKRQHGAGGNGVNKIPPLLLTFYYVDILRFARSLRVKLNTVQSNGAFSSFQINFALPQLMAALAYSRNTPGVWFLNPQAWVSQHLFKTASIWDIPLVKPRYTCMVPAADATNVDVAEILWRNLEYLSHGGTCENGQIAPEP